MASIANLSHQRLILIKQNTKYNIETEKILNKRCQKITELSLWVTLMICEQRTIIESIAKALYVPY